MSKAKNKYNSKRPDWRIGIPYLMKDKTIYVVEMNRKSKHNAWYTMGTQ